MCNAQDKVMDGGMMPEKAECCASDVPDWKQRMREEYWFVKNKYDKLHKMCIKYEAGTLDFVPNCDLLLLNEQKSAMGHYLHCLEVRAEIEGVDLNN
jgi:hypothetical protein